MNSLNTKTHSSKGMAEFCFENADVKSICYCQQRMETKLSLSSECVEMKLCKLCTSFTSHPHSSCGMVWSGVEWSGVEWCGMEWCGVVWNGVVWNGVVWNGVEWCGVVWYRTLRVNT